jgi:hypothetical protein
MFKRLFWMGVGVGASFWVRRRVRGTVERYQPQRLSGELVGTVRRVGDDVRAAVHEGRVAMREREAELRRALPG